MAIGLVISLVGAVLALVGAFGVPWVDEDVVKFAEPEMFMGWDWWTVKIFVLLALGCAAASGIGFAVARKKLFALAGLIGTGLMLVLIVYTPFLIRGDVIDMIQAGALVKETRIAMYYGFHIGFASIAVMAIGYIWTLGAQPILGPEDRLLRVAMLWKGKLIREKTFTEKHDITIGDGLRSDFVVPTKDINRDLGKMFPLFKADNKGNYSVALLREWRGRVNLGGVLAPVTEFVKKHTGDATGANYVPITPGDWGVLEFGEIELFFQFVRPDVIIGHRPVMAMDGAMFAATVSSLFVVAFFFTLSQFLWDPAGTIEQRKVEKRVLKVEMMISQEKDEKLLEIGEEEDTTGKKAEGEEGKFGDPDKDPTIESKVPKRDGQMVSKIDPKKVGLADVLSNRKALGSAISSILSDNADSFDNRMAVAMAGTGSELVVGYGAGGMGFKGTGPGGGGTGGYGRIHGLGRVDTGGGMGLRAGLGTKKAANVGKVSLGGMTGTGFCQRNNIQSVVMQRAGAIRACYEAQLQIHEGLAGKIAVRWTINLEGAVEGVAVTENSMGNTAVQQCVVRAISHMRFAKPEGGVCVVSWPFVFNPG